MMGIYILINLVNSKYYIGSTINFTERWRLHLSKLNDNKHVNRHLQFAWNKYGADAFKFYVLEYVTDRIILLEREQFWIERSKCYKDEIGYNLRLKAESNLGLRWSEETKRKMALASTGRIASEETRKKISVAHKGIKETKERSKEYKENMSKVKSGVVKSEEWQNNIKAGIEASSKIFKNRRNSSKWPHEKGKRCECEECKNKLREISRNYQRSKRQTNIEARVI